MSFNFESLISRHFDSDEVNEIKKLSDYGRDKLLFERLQVDDMIADLSGRILDEIKDKTKSIGERYKLFIKQLKQKSKQNSERQIVPIKDNLSPSEKFVEKAEKEFRESLGKKSFFGPVLLGLFDWVKDAENIPEETSMWDRFLIGIKGSIGEGILRNFGLREFKKKIKDFFAGDNGDEKQEDTGPITSINQKIKETDTNLPKLSEEKEKVDLGKNYYQIGMSIILWISNGDKKKEQNYDFLLGYLRYYKLSEIDSFNLEKKVKETYDESLKDLKAKLKSEKNIALLKGTFTNKILKNIIKPDGKNINPRLEDYFKIEDKGGKIIKSGKDRLNEIYRLLENNSFTINDLYLNEIGIFYMESFPSFGGLQLEGLLDFSTELYSKMTGKNLDELKENLKDRASEVIPKSLILGFQNFSETSGPKFGGNEIIKNYNNNDSRILAGVSGKIDKLSDLDSSERQRGKEKLKQVIKFKNDLISKDFLKSDILFFDNVYKKRFLKNLTYLDVITLYSITNGETDLNSLATSNLLSFWYIISRIISKNDTTLSTKYLGVVLQEIEGNGSFSKEEREILNIYLVRFGKKIMEEEVKSINKFIGFFSSSKFIYPVAGLGAVGGGLGFYKNIKILILKERDG